MSNLKKLNVNLYLICLILLILFGIGLRSFYFFSNQFLYMDDASLAVNILNRNFFELFQTLDNAQKAPPLFMVATLVLHKIFGMSEFVFRTIPFVASIVSIFLFWSVAEKYLASKLSRIVALALFVINSKLIYYSQSFKQYSTDVLVVLVFLFAFTCFDFSKLTYKKSILIAILVLFLSLFSYPILFVFPAFVLILVYKNFNIDFLKKISIICFPFVCVCLYYLVQALGINSTQSDLIYMWKNIENCGFFSLNMQQNIETIKTNIFYFFDCSNFILFLFLFISGMFLYFIWNRKVFSLFCGIFILSIIASFLMIYPFSERTILFLLPILILIISKNIDALVLKKPFTYFLTICVIILFNGYNSAYFKNILYQPISPEYTAPRKAFEYISKNLTEDDVLLVIHHASLFEFYSKYYGFNNKVEILGITFDEDIMLKNNIAYFDWLDSLKIGKSYWFFSLYLPYLENMKIYTKDYFEQNNVQNVKIDGYENYLFYKFVKK